MMLSVLSILGMHEQKGPYAYALFKKMMCYSGYCGCGLGGCQNKQLISQEKLEQATKKLPINRSWRN